jgi:hypothetical protein
MVAVRTEAMPRIIFSARLMSATSALSSSVIIIWGELGMVVAIIYIISLNYLLLSVCSFYSLLYGNIVVMRVGSLLSQSILLSEYLVGPFLKGILALSGFL